MPNDENKFPWTYETTDPQPVPQQNTAPGQTVPTETDIPLDAPVAMQEEPAAAREWSAAMQEEPAAARYDGESGFRSAEPVYRPAEPVFRPVEPQPAPGKPKKKKKPVGIGAVIAVALICSLLGGIAGAAIMGAGKTVAPTPEDSTTVLHGERDNTVIEITKIDTSKVMTPAEVYAANVNSTVGITTSITTNFWGYQTTSAASGSGFIISQDGYILTNHHVIEDSDAITVSFYDGTSKEAKLIGYDASNDIAVLKVEAEGLTPVVLGDSQNMNVGDSVIAIGNPLGELTFSLTAGTISALDREVTISTGSTMRLMQTDCAINSGNSGGALFNLYGEVIGITNAKYSGNSSSGASIDNIAFAIPLNTVRPIVESLIEKGYVSKPYIGVSITDVSEETQSYGLPKGAAVKGIEEESPAAAAGLQINDIITHVDGTQIAGSSDLVSYVGQCEVGQVLKLTVFRNGSTIEVEITIGEQIQAAIEDTTQQQTQQGQQGQQGQQQNPYSDFFPFWNFGS